MPIEIHDGAPWIYRRRSCGELPNDSLSDVLAWILEQLNFGHFSVERDATGDGVSLTLGLAAAIVKPLRQDSAVDFAEGRNRSIAIAGLFAAARERGVEPEYASLSEQANAVARNSETGRMNTEFHYAFELASILRRISGATFLFEAPPILGRADSQLVDMLGEASRCLYFGLYRSSVSICRAVVEAVLESKVDGDELRREMATPKPNGAKPGKIEALIRIATRRGYLTEPLGQAAHFVRKSGNDAIHGAQLDEQVTWGVLDRTRHVVEHVYSRSA
jgi:hypothetical protein